jgi:hypothetical protein
MRVTAATARLIDTHAGHGHLIGGGDVASQALALLRAPFSPTPPHPQKRSCGSSILPAAPPLHEASELPSESKGAAPRRRTVVGAAHPALLGSAGPRPTCAVTLVGNRPRPPGMHLKLSLPHGPRISSRRRQPAHTSLVAAAARPTHRKSSLISQSMSHQMSTLMSWTSPVSGSQKC